MTRAALRVLARSAAAAEGLPEQRGAREPAPPTAGCSAREAGHPPSTLHAVSHRNRGAPRQNRRAPNPPYTAQRLLRQGVRLSRQSPRLSLLQKGNHRYTVVFTTVMSGLPAGLR